jgi:hypothetical protein
MKKDLKLLLVFGGIAVVQAVLDPGPLRESLEMWLFLQLVPVVGFLVEWDNVVSTTEAGSMMFYIKLMILVAKEPIKIWLWVRIKQIFSKKNNEDFEKHVKS